MDPEMFVQTFLGGEGSSPVILLPLNTGLVIVASATFYFGLFIVSMAPTPSMRFVTHDACV